MLKLIRNCSHKNETAVFYSDKDSEKSIIKASSSQQGIAELKQEVTGWQWYGSQRYPGMGKDFCRIVQSNENYIKIKIQYIEGYQRSYIKGIQVNAGLVRNVVEHYCNVWQKYAGSNPPLHGDLSVDNIIINKDGVNIIDWEYFSQQGPPFGFDAYNLLFEQLWFSLQGKNKPTPAELNILLDNIRMIRAFSAESSRFYDAPLFLVQKYIRENQGVWHDQIYRLPVLLFSEEKVKIIDAMIKAHI